MSNDTVSASAIGLPSRRLFLASAPTAAVFISLREAVAEGSPLTTLIKRHHAARQAFCDAIDVEQEREQAYEAAYPKPILIPTFTGQYHELTCGRDHCAKSIAEQYERQRQMLGGLERLAPEIARQAKVAIDAKEQQALAEMERLLAIEEALQEEFGLGPAKRKWQETNDAEKAAAIALLSYRCHTIEEARVKATYLRSSPLFDEIHEPELMEAFVGSFLG